MCVYKQTTDIINMQKNLPPGETEYKTDYKWSLEKFRIQGVNGYVSQLSTCYPII